MDESQLIHAYVGAGMRQPMDRLGKIFEEKKVWVKPDKSRERDEGHH